MTIRKQVEEIVKTNHECYRETGYFDVETMVDELCAMFPTREEIQKEFEAAYWGAETPDEQACFPDRMYALFTKERKKEEWCEHIYWYKGAWLDENGTVGISEDICPVKGCHKPRPD